MANFAATNTNITDTLDYLLSGYNSLGNEFEGKSGSSFVYLTGNQVPPFVTPTQPAPYNPTTRYIETDMFLPITISDARQRVAVGMQMRFWVGYDVIDGPGFASADIYLSLNRYKVNQPFFFPTVVQERLISFSSDTSNPVNGDIVTTGTSDLTFQPIIDTPGEIGDYIYWQEVFMLNTSNPPYFDWQWIGVDYRNISASMIKP